VAEILTSSGLRPVMGGPMNRIVNAVKLDFRTGKFYLSMYPILFLVALGIGALVKMPIFTVILTIVLGVFISGGVFAISERNHGERLYGTLPLRRSDVVVGRYMFGLVIGLGATVVAGLLGWLAATISGSDMGSLGPNRGTLTPGASYDLLIFWAAIGAAFLYYCFSTSVAFPIYFRFGFSKTYVLTMLPLYLVVLAALLVTRYFNVTLATSSATQFFNNHIWLLPVIGVVGGVTLLVISIWISTRIYSHKEI